MPSSTFAFTGTDGQQITAYRWDPPGRPRAVMQLTHGMGEQALRYEKFALAMNAQGLAVYAQDHRGHGATAGEGVLGDLGEDGWTALIADIGLLSAGIRAEQTGLPLILMGHSMGSFAVQQYLLDHSADVDAVILTGTAVIDLLEPALDLDHGPMPRLPGDHPGARAWCRRQDGSPEAASDGLRAGSPRAGGRVCRGARCSRDRAAGSCRVATPRLR